MSVGPSVSWTMSPVRSFTRNACGPLPARSERKTTHFPSAVQVVCVWYGFASLAGSVVRKTSRRARRPRRRPSASRSASGARRSRRKRLAAAAASAASVSRMRPVRRSRLAPSYADRVRLASSIGRLYTEFEFQRRPCQRGIVDQVSARRAGFRPLEPEQDGSADSARHARGLTLGPQQLRGLELVPDGRDRVQQREAGLGQARERTDGAVAWREDAEERGPVRLLERHPSAREVEDGKTPVVEVPAELGEGPVLSGTRVVHGVLPHVEARALHAVLPDAVRSAAEPADALRRGRRRAQVEAEQVGFPVERVRVLDAHASAGRDPPRHDTAAAAVAGLDHRLAGILPGGEAVEAERTRDVGVLGRAHLPAAEAHAAWLRDGLARARRPQVRDEPRHAAEAGRSTVPLDGQRSVGAREAEAQRARGDRDLRWSLLDTHGRSAGRVRAHARLADPPGPRPHVAAFRIPCRDVQHIGVAPPRRQRQPQQARGARRHGRPRHRAARDLVMRHARLTRCREPGEPPHEAAVREVGEVVAVLDAEVAAACARVGKHDGRPDLAHRVEAALLLAIRADDAVRRAVAGAVDPPVPIRARDALVARTPRGTLRRRTGWRASRPSSPRARRRCRRRRGRAGTPSA